MSGVKGDDVEEGSTTSSLLYPGIGNEENDLRWGFIRKVYYILASQILLTTIVSAVTVLYLPVNNILHGKTILLILLILPLLMLLPLYFYRQKHPLNFVFLGLYTVTLSVSIGIACATIDGKIVLEALILTSAVVLSLTGYTFCASKRGQDFSFLGPILFASLIVLFVTGFLQENIESEQLALPVCTTSVVNDLCFIPCSLKGQQLTCNVQESFLPGHIDPLPQFLLQYNDLSCSFQYEQAGVCTRQPAKATNISASSKKQAPQGTEVLPVTKQTQGQLLH